MISCRSVSCAACIMLTATACSNGSRRIDDPIGNVPVTRQRAVSRVDFSFRWPLSVGAGVLGCDQDNSILFRTQGVTYQLAGGTDGVAGIERLRMPEPSPPPTNPLQRMKQSDRMAAFASMTACAAHPSDDRCPGATLERFGLSRNEWTQIEAEGRERRWPPLSREYMSLDPLIAAGRTLCAK
jgi:hypothetical protein